MPDDAAREAAPKVARLAAVADVHDPAGQTAAAAAAAVVGKADVGSPTASSGPFAVSSSLAAAAPGRAATAPARPGDRAGAATIGSAASTKQTEPSATLVADPTDRAVTAPPRTGESRDAGAAATATSESTSVVSIDHGQSEREVQESLLQELDRQVGRLGLADLHTHLLGMGSADFWVDQIMRTYLVRVVHQDKVATKNNWQPLLQRLQRAEFPGYSNRRRKPVDVEGNELITLLEKHGDDALKAAIAEKSDKDIQQFFVAKFTHDVVFTEETLFAACGIVKDDGGRAKARYTLETLLCNAASGFDFRQTFCEYIVLNERKQQFQLVVGIANADLVEHMRPNRAADGPAAGDDAHTLQAIVRNWFSFCGTDGETAARTDLATYRGNFTPEFYPMRFTAKDAIYEQRLETLAILLNRVLSDYGQAGVHHVEFSFGANDILRPHVMNVLVEQTYTKSLIKAAMKQEAGRTSHATRQRTGRTSDTLTFITAPESTSDTDITEAEDIIDPMEQNIQEPIALDEFGGVGTADRAVGAEAPTSIPAEAVAAVSAGSPTDFSIFRSTMRQAKLFQATLRVPRPLTVEAAPVPMASGAALDMSAAVAGSAHATWFADRTPTVPGTTPWHVAAATPARPTSSARSKDDSASGTGGVLPSVCESVFRRVLTLLFVYRVANWGLAINIRASRGLRPLNRDCGTHMAVSGGVLLFKAKKCRRFFPDGLQTGRLLPSRRRAE